MLAFLCTFLLLLPSLCAAELLGPLSDDFQQWLIANSLTRDKCCEIVEMAIKAMTLSELITVLRVAMVEKLPVRILYVRFNNFEQTENKYTFHQVTNVPVIFIHGNSDAALYLSKTATGWTNSIQYFLGQGYTQAELYATSWGDTNASNAVKRTHDCYDLLRLRRFILAVLAYTGAPKVSLITHSMGVTLGRKAIKGGAVTGSDGRII
ncbi:unnamed protein product [Strongylus vulgaris]|uniref:Triacylglycerol lipase n=1 Tax=Strongylus vulgaris TaxID=40348 RepID=A0A3P7IRM4_STRVU|nr:unnamed protein product [Strongylus vulgaris]